ncbi:Imm53 family immunity protein [Prevotella sp. oral taxon 317]|uniref:Imm53 family immunity protein n=1 Tax=Prevotella sp. oral taxon 317 TaxID=652721 RepID=UPI0005C560E1|nr:Imm53 family immunity protein [Prevotella sp. oral taxon 317]
MSSIIQWLQDWTKSQIDGDWEHELGISISMLDNPGWILSADISNYGDILKETKPLGRDNDVDWIDFEIRVIAKTYVYIEIFGDISKLNKILYSFKAIIGELEEIERYGKGILSAQRIKEIIDDAPS